jgi:hypothetical protein
MKPTVLVWLAVFVGVALALSATGLSGWAAVAVVAGSLVLAIPLSVKRFGQERNLVRAVWRTLTTR